MARTSSSSAGAGFRLAKAIIAPGDRSRSVLYQRITRRHDAFAMPPLSAIIVLTGALRGAGDTRYPILLTWIGFLVVRIPLAYLLTRTVGILGFEDAQLTTEAVVAFVAELVALGALGSWLVGPRTLPRPVGRAA